MDAMEIVKQLRRMALNQKRYTEPVENKAATIIEQQAKRIVELECENAIRAGIVTETEPYLDQLASAMTALYAADEWIKTAPHGWKCNMNNENRTADFCDCGKDHLLKTLDEVLSREFPVNGAPNAPSDAGSKE